MRLLPLILELMVITIGATQESQTNLTSPDDDIWVNLGKMTGILLQNCWSWASHGRQQDVVPHMQTCLKQKALVALGRILQCDVIEVFDGVAFVRYKESSGNFSRRMDNIGEDLDLDSEIVRRIADVLETHVLKIRLKRLTWANYEINEARHRHRRNNMMPFMMFGLVGLGMVLIPMGFKFLAVLGGKALLLAKMALLLSSIQGLKKVATSNLNYGLYHSPPPNPYYRDRHGFDDIPEEHTDVLHHGYIRS